MISSTKLDHAFGKSLRKRRLAKLFSQEALALESDLSRAYISDLEMGKKDPSLFTVFKLADALKLNLSGGTLTGDLILNTTTNGLQLHWRPVMLEPIFGKAIN